MTSFKQLHTDTISYTVPTYQAWQTLECYNQKHTAHVTEQKIHYNSMTTHTVILQTHKRYVKLKKYTTQQVNNY